MEQGTHLHQLRHLYRPSMNVDHSGESSRGTSLTANDRESQVMNWKTTVNGRNENASEVHLNWLEQVTASTTVTVVVKERRRCHSVGCSRRRCRHSSTRCRVCHAVVDRCIFSHGRRHNWWSLITQNIPSATSHLSWSYRNRKVSRFLTANHHTIRLYCAIHVGSRWKIQDKRQIKNTDNTETKHNQEKAIVQYPCFNLQHSSTVEPMTFTNGINFQHNVDV